MNKYGVLSYEEYCDGLRWYYLEKYLKSQCDDYIRIILSERYGVTLSKNARRFDALTVIAAREGWSSDGKP